MMMATGGLEEARSLSARGLDPELPVMKALGVQELIAHLRGAMSRGEAVDLAKRNTRRLAKRQLTWFRHQAPDWPRSRDGRASVTALKSSLP
jgi:tRNA dimethylallyltransferase